MSDANSPNSFGAGKSQGSAPQDNTKTWVLLVMRPDGDAKAILRPTQASALAVLRGLKQAIPDLDQFKLGEISQDKLDFLIEGGILQAEMTEDQIYSVSRANLKKLRTEMN